MYDVTWLSLLSLEIHTKPRTRYKQKKEKKIKLKQ
jgi:hypothetical protein